MLLLRCLFLLALPLGAQSIETLLGDGTPGMTATQVNNPYGLVIGPDHALYFGDIGNHAVRRLDLQTKRVTTVAGNGQAGNTGDGGPAVEASLGEPYEVRFDRQGNLFLVDMPHHVVRRVDRRTKRISTVAGTGQAGFSGDGGPATAAQLRQPHSIAFDRQGRLLICDIGNHRVRRVDLHTGLIETYLGTGEKRLPQEGVAAIGQPLFGPRAIDLDAAGNLYLALREGNAVYRVDAHTGVLTRVAGTGDKGNSGDGGPATAAQLNGPKGIALAPDGKLYLADTENHAIRGVSLQDGKITTVAGTGQRGDGPAGNPRQCRLNRPHGVYVGSNGTVYIADSESHRIRVLR